MGRVGRVGRVGRLDGEQKCPLIFFILRYIEHYTYNVLTNFLWVFNFGQVGGPDAKTAREAFCEKISSIFLVYFFLVRSFFVAPFRTVSLRGPVLYPYGEGEARVPSVYPAL